MLTTHVFRYGLRDFVAYILSTYTLGFGMSSSANINRGCFITVEGIDGTGKTTQSRLLKESLDNLGYSTILVFEPGGTEYGQRARELFFKFHEEMAPEAEVGLLLTAKTQLLQTVIRPALRAGKIVICDRYTDTLYAYQHHAKGYDREMMRAMIEAFGCGDMPDLTVLFDIEPETAIVRAERRNAERLAAGGGDQNSFDTAALDFRRRLRNGFLSETTRRDRGETFVIQGDNLSIDETRKEVLAGVQQFLKRFPNLRVA